MSRVRALFREAPLAFAYFWLACLERTASLSLHALHASSHAGGADNVKGLIESHVHVFTFS